MNTNPLNGRIRMRAMKTTNQHAAALVASLVVLPIITTLWATQALAVDYPSSGVVFKISDSIKYNCLLSKFGNELTCEFAKVSIRRAADPSELQAAIDRYVQNTKDDKPKENCETFLGFFERLKDEKLTAQEKSKLNKFAAQERQDVIREWEARYNHCKKPSALTATEIVRAAHDKNLRTCRVSIHSSNLTFRRIANQSWVANDGPAVYDPCGSVHVSRFEKSELSEKWKYVVRTTVANPDGLKSAGESCKAFEAEDSYEPLALDHFARCDYITFDDWAYPDLSVPGSIGNHRLEELVRQK